MVDTERDDLLMRDKCKLCRGGGSMTCRKCYGKGMLQLRSRALRSSSGISGTRFIHPARVTSHRQHERAVDHVARVRAISATHGSLHTEACRDHRWMHKEAQWKVHVFPHVCSAQHHY